MKKILILYTGGTIGMDYIDGKLSVISGLFYSQLQLLQPLIKNEFDLIEYPDLIDSSDINIAHWIKIIEDISSNYYNYQGFVVVHGTDTMAYTASVLAFSLRGLNKPVVLTGAQLPLVHRRSDGWSNLIEAFYAARNPDLNEVAITFNHKLLRGCRAQKISTNRFLGFDSVDEEPLAEFGIDVIWHRSRWLNANKFAFSPIIPNPDIKILDLTIVPGYTTNFITETLLTTCANAIILRVYGSGTIPMHDTNFVDAIKKATERGVIVVAVTQVIEGRVASIYSNSRLSKLGIISGGDMTHEAALAKLLVLLSTNMDTNGVIEALNNNLVGELTEQ